MATYITFSEVARQLGLSGQVLVNRLKKKRILDANHLPPLRYVKKKYFICVVQPHPVDPAYQLTFVYVTVAGKAFIRRIL